MSGSRIFVSYRRQDSPGFAGRIADRLERHFGSDAVFRDVETIDYGTDYVEAIDHALGECAAFVVVIGPLWMTLIDIEGRPRIHGDDDFVRLEVSKALARGVRVIPVLVQDAKMPNAADLPVDLRGLVRRQAIAIRDERFGDDLQRLIEAIDSEFHSLRPFSTGTRRAGRLHPRRRGLPQLSSIGIAAIGLCALGTTALIGRGWRPSGGEPPQRAQVREQELPASASSPLEPSADVPEAAPIRPAVSANSREPKPPARPKPPQPLPPAAPSPKVGTSWEPLPMKQSIFGKVMNRSAGDRRARMMQDGPPYRSVAAANRALATRAIDPVTHTDTLWVLEQWRAYQRDKAAQSLRLNRLDRTQYNARLTQIEAQYRGL